MSAHLLATAAADGAKLWTYQSGGSDDKGRAKSTGGTGGQCRLQHMFDANETGGGVETVAWNEDGSLLALAGWDGLVTIRSVDGSLVDTISTDGLGGGTHCITSMCMAQRGRQLLLAGSQGVVRCWDRRDARWLDTLAGHTSGISALALDIDQTHLASASVQGDLLIHNLQKNVLHRCQLATTQALNSVDYSKFKKPLLICGGDDGSVHMLDSNRSAAPLQVFANAHSAPVKGIMFSPYNRFLVCSAGLDKRIVLYDTERKGEIKTLTTEHPLTTLAFKSDGVTIATGTINGKVLLFDLRASSKPLANMWAHEPHPVKASVFQTRLMERKPSSKRNPSMETPIATGSGREVNTAAPSSAQVPSPSVHETPTPSLDKETPSARVQTAAGYGTYMDMFSPVKNNSQEVSIDSPIQEIGTDLSDRHRRPVSYGALPVSAAVSSARTASSESRATTLTPPLPPPSEYDTAYQREYSSRALEREEAPITPLEARAKTERPVSALPSEHAVQDTRYPPPSTRIVTHRRRFSALADATITDAKRPAVDLPLQPMHEPAAPERVIAEPMSMTRPRLPSLTVDTTVAANVSAPTESTADPTGGAFQLRVLESVVEDCLQSFREEVRADLQNLHLELLRQFHIQRQEVEALMQHYGEADALREEVERLRDENQRLRARINDSLP